MRRNTKADSGRCLLSAYARSPENAAKTIISPGMYAKRNLYEPAQMTYWKYETPPRALVNDAQLQPLVSVLHIYSCQKYRKLPLTEFGESLCTYRKGT